MIYAFVPITPNTPIGGIGALVEYITSANILMGEDSGAILTDSSYVKDWLPPSQRNIKIYPTTHKVTKKDFIIIPEVCPDVVNNYPEAKKKFLSVLNWYYYDEVFAKKTPAQLGYDYILTNSKYTKNYLENKNINLPISIISHIIDPALYSVRMRFEDRPHNSIVILNRKNNQHIQPILNYLKNQTHQVAILNNINPVLLGKIFSDNQIFINLGYPEGFGRPPAEAMACGCIVVGFSGGGSLEFLHHKKNSFVTTDGDEKKLIKDLDYVLNKMTPESKRAMSQNASEYILNQYSEIHTVDQFYNVFKSFVPDSIQAQNNLTQFTKSYQQRKIIPCEINEKDILIDQLMNENNYLKNTLKTSKGLFVNSKIYKIWRLYRNVIELKFLKKKFKLDF